jgi:2'-5' RNA ligase
LIAFVLNGIELSQGLRRFVRRVGSEPNESGSSQEQRQFHPTSQSESQHCLPGRTT